MNTKVKLRCSRNHSCEFVSIRGLTLMMPAAAMLLLGACRTAPPAHPPEPVVQRGGGVDDRDAARIKELADAAEEARAREAKDKENALGNEDLSARRIG